MAEQKKQRHMAQNIYSNPVLRGTSGTFDGFSIDFRGVKTPLSTYWSLCNFGMDLTEFRKKYPDARGGGAYAGLQNTVIGRKAILSFWETFYDGDKQRHIAKRVFPGGKEHLFGGEGDGTNMIAEYLWKDNVWYRMVLRSWRDTRNGTTFVGQWFLNRESGEWRLISYFDTGFKKSFIRGNLSQFQENFWDKHYKYIRKFHIKNIFAKEKDGEWKYIERTSLSYDDPNWKYHTGGTHDFGATEEYFYGSSGSDVPDQAAYDAVRPLSAVYGVKQKEELTDGARFITPAFSRENGGMKIEYKPKRKCVPILLCEVKVTDAEGNVLFENRYSRPEVTSFVFGKKLPKEGLTCTCTLTDIYGRNKTFEWKDGD